MQRYLAGSNLLYHTQRRSLQYQISEHGLSALQIIGTIDIYTRADESKASHLRISAGPGVVVALVYLHILSHFFSSVCDV